MKHRNRIATLAAAGLVIAGAAIASPATAGGSFGLSIAGPGYFVAPVAGAYTAPYYSQPAYGDSYYGVPSYESGNEQYYYYAAPSYHGPVFRTSRVEADHRAHFRNEEHGYQYRRWNDNPGAHRR